MLAGEDRSPGIAHGISSPEKAECERLPTPRPAGILGIQRLLAEVAEWQTQRIQNPPRLTPRVGSTPTFGNPKKHAASTLAACFFVFAE